MSSFECNNANSMMSRMVELMIGSAPAVAAEVDASAVPSEPSVASDAVASATEEASSLFCTDEELDFLLAACVDSELMDSSVPTDVAAAAPTDAAVDEDEDDEEDDDAVTQVQGKKGKRKTRKNKKKKKPTTAPTAATAATAERSLTIPPEIQQLFTARNQVHHDRLLSLFRTQATIPVHVANSLDSLWFFVGKILTQPQELAGNKGIYHLDVQDIDGVHAKCLFDTTIGHHRFVSLNKLTIGKTIFIPHAVKGGDNRQFVFSQTMEDCIHVFPIHLEDVRRIKWSAVPTDVNCELCSEFIKQDFALCDECLRVLYCSAKCKQDDWFRHNRMCAVTDDVMEYVQNLENEKFEF